MSDIGPRESRFGLENHGILHTGKVYWNLTTAQLYEAAVQRNEGLVAESGALVVETGKHTGRSPNDKFVVREPSSEEHVAWGKINVPIDSAMFDRLHSRVLAYLQAKDLFVQDLYVGAYPKYRMTVRFVNEKAWHDLFVRSLFLRPGAGELQDCVPDFTVIHAPHFHANTEIDGTRSDAFIIVHLGKKLIIIGGTAYAGEQKKSIFSVMNYLLPLKGVLSMHCSCNYSKEGEVALFFGLSGTGKTTLSADPERVLIGDDEHAWSDDGVFNIEGGCYAKVINLSQEAEPQIWAATRRFGSVLENVVIDPMTRDLDLDDDSLTENTRAAYPVKYIPGCDLTGVCGHPKDVVFLTADAFGVLPPVAKLSPEAAAYHFLTGYTARVAGTEAGVTEPAPTFSTCFGGPFMTLRPGVYAKLLSEKIARHGSNVWLINTGWSGGPATGAGKRMKIAYTRAMVHAALNGELDNVEYVEHPQFNLMMPTSCPGVPDEILNPRLTWEDKDAYDADAKKLAGMFVANFKQYHDEVSQAVIDAGPRA
ncbi:MAG: phosphoenolpyruvate carboxykinase (ATP) [Armatimonadetes bacterium]|nr:phosphoenolpyruvate carboxykinase (ATP) [Armatimonadota bacterium]